MRHDPHQVCSSHKVVVYCKGPVHEAHVCVHGTQIDVRARLCHVVLSGLPEATCLTGQSVLHRQASCSQ